jgi:dipeptidyl aminopeptidase/acylaminoacyl peptidase
MTRRQNSRILSPIRATLAAPGLILAGALLAPLPVAAQQGWNPNAVIQQETFAKPPQEVVDAVLAPRYLNVTLNQPSPDHKWFLNTVGDGMPGVDTYGRAHHNLGGFQVDIRANRARQLTNRADVGLEIISAADGSKRAIQIPANARVSNAQWSPDGSKIAYFAHFDDGTQIYVADVANGRSRQVTRTPVLATIVTSFEWTADSKSIVTVLFPDGRGAPPPEPPVVNGPAELRLTEEGENKLRTYADLLQNPYEKDLVEYYSKGQLAKIDANSRAVTKIGAPAMIRSVETSPDGSFFHVETMTRPFSFIVPVSSFPGVEEIWGTDGKVLAKIDDRKMNTGIEPDSTERRETENKPRSFSWRPDGQGLSYLHLAPAPAGQQDSAQSDTGNGQANRARRKDRVMQWTAPFNESTKKVVYEADNRISNVRYSDDAQILFLSESSGGTNVDYAILLSDPTKKHVIARGGSGGGRGFGGGRGGDQEIYKDPGSLVTKRNAKGIEVVQLSSDGSSVFLEGTQFSKTPLQEAPKPFLDRVTIATGAKTRVYEGENGTVSESILQVVDDDAKTLIVSRQGPKTVPDSYRRDIASGTLAKLTNNRDYTPALTNARRERFDVTRPDGFKFKVEVLYPPGQENAKDLPALMWFYPREYTSQESYDRTNQRYDRNAFPNLGVRSMEIMAHEGYAIIQPDAPIIGEDGRMNDNYENDLRNNLAAVIDELDRRDIVDRQRIGIGGHSYGAFSTVNAMVHTPFFRAGIAGDGNYNRTLTPLNFQSERRELFGARETYLAMSPLLYANNLTGALLMYHGLEDQNVGTDPTHSPRLFHVLNGLGKTAAMYRYAYEDHGPAAEETILDLWARWTAWLDKYVKNAEPLNKVVTTTDKPISQR